MNRVIRQRAKAGLTVAVGIFALGGFFLLSGCPSQSTDQTSTLPPSVARAAGFQGSIYGGRQPIAGASVVAYAAGTSVGAVPTEIGTDVTNSSGRFNINFSPAPASGQVVYVTASGGNGGAGNNSAIGLMTVGGIVGSTLAPVPGTVNINELTTVAAAAVLKDYIHFGACSTITNNSQTGTCISIPGSLDLAHMAATVTNLVNAGDGQASAFLAVNSQTAGSPLTGIFEKLNTLASVLAACVDSGGPMSTACSGLFDATGGHPDTLMAAWLVAEMPTVSAKAQALYTLTPNSPVFSPVLASVPATRAGGFWTLGGRRFALTTNAGDNTISAFQISNTSGDLSPLQGSPALTGSHPYSMAVTPSGSYAYVPNALGNSISIYRIGLDGTLNLVNNQATVNTEPVEIAVSPSGLYAYVTFFGGEIVTFSIGADGALSAAGVISGGGNSLPAYIIVAPDGHTVYVAEQGLNAIKQYNVGQNGTLSPVGTASTNPDPLWLSFDPSGSYLFVANGSGSVQTFQIGPNGSLTLISGVNVPQPANGAGGTPHVNSVLADASGRYVYASVWAINKGALVASYIVEYKIIAFGQLQLIGQVQTGNKDYPYSLRTDPSGRYVYVVDTTMNVPPGPPINIISEYKIGPSGTLSAIGRIPAQAGPFYIAMNPNGRYMYVANLLANNVSEFEIGDSGAIAPMSAPAPTSSNPFSLAVDSRWRYAYVANELSGSITAYTIGIRGKLSSAGTPLQTGGFPTAVAVNPAAQFAYVATLAGQVSAYTISADGALNAIGTAQAGGFPVAIAIAPAGHFVYVLNEGSSGISEFSVGSDGSLTSLGTPVSTGQNTNPTAIAVDQAGHYVYVTLGPNGTAGAAGNVIMIFTISADGTLTQLGQPVPSSGLSPSAVAVSPNGRFVYVTNLKSDNVSAYAVGTDGTLTALGTVPTGDKPRVLTVGPVGRYVYATNQGDSTVSVYKVANDGSLTAIVGSPYTAGDRPNTIAVGP